MIDTVVGLALVLGLWVASTVSIADVMASLLALNVWGLMVYHVAAAIWGCS
ncbi:hypothetical protein CHIBITOTORO_00090 [Serratia phage vB_SmaM-ChibiTotoro]|nr:hypothetical protein CHIBITOTORO_00090 [Serratia phage vB_SmaM-ChibiTotoro]